MAIGDAREYLRCVRLAAGGGGGGASWGTSIEKALQLGKVDGMPAGRPSSVQPMAGECDWPKIESLSTLPIQELMVYASLSVTLPPSRR